MGEISKIFGVLEDMCLVINPDLVVKSKVMNPESAPAILYEVAQINPNIVKQISDVEYKAITLQIVLMTKGNDTVELVDLYEDFQYHVYNSLYSLIQASGVECNYLEIGRFVPLDELFGNATDNILSGELILNMKL